MRDFLSFDPKLLVYGSAILFLKTAVWKLKIWKLMIENNEVYNNKSFVLLKPLV